MKTFSLFAFVIAIGFGAASMRRADHSQTPDPNATAARITDGAFRDGLYLGRLAAERGGEQHVAIGRWAHVEDRSSFTAGYQQGYSEFLARRVAPTTAGLGTD
jgi:hypothetical protein